MDHRIPLKHHTVLAFEGMPCCIETVIGQGSNAVVYKGWYPDALNPELRHHVLIKELFPFHPQKKIWREENGFIAVADEARDLWLIHRESFETGNRIHLRLLSDHPGMMAMGANLNSFSQNGTLYSVLGYTGGRSLQEELNKRDASLRCIANRMIRLLDALEVFHKSGYLHLDISPDNIMLVGQEDGERIFLIDYNSARETGSRDSSYLSCKTGYSAPEVSTGNPDAIGFESDLYSVAAVFYRCLMGRSLTLEEELRPKAPDGRDSLLLQSVPQTVSAMAGSILKKGLSTLPGRRYRSIGQLRQAFQELIDRIDCVGVTHWALWETGRRSVEELIRTNPSLRYVKEQNGLYPIRLEKNGSLSLEQYLQNVLSPEGNSGLILAQGGMGKTTLLLHTAMLRGKRYSPASPAICYLSLNGWGKADTHYIRNRILMGLRFRREENTYDSAMHALHRLLEQPVKTKSGEMPAVLLLLDGLNEIQGDIAPLVQEINELNAMTGVRILAASRSTLPELNLEAAELMPLNVEDIEDALGRNGLLIPGNPDVIRLLRTPLILSIYIQASEAGGQLEIQNEEELIRTYMDSLLEKEIRQLPEDSPRRWQVDAALNFVLPAIAAETKKRHAALTREQLLNVMERCWRTLNSRGFRKAYPQWIGHGADIRGEAETAEEWFGLMIHSLLWQQLAMLTKDDSDGYRIFHQTVAEHLAGYKIPVVKGKRWIAVLAAVLICTAAAAGYRYYEALEETRAAIELGAAGYSECGRLYDQLRKLTDYALEGDTDGFRMYYDRTVAELYREQEQTASEKTEAEQIARSSEHDQLPLIFGSGNPVYEYEILWDLLRCPDERSAFYTEQLPLLKIWMESEMLREKTPDFAAAFSSLLEADANLAAERYHRAVAVHLSGRNAAWKDKINALLAMADNLDAHRNKDLRENRNQELSTLTGRYQEANTEYEAARSRLENYVRNLSLEMQTETADLQMQLEQISEKLKQDNRLAEAAGIDAVVIRLKNRQELELALFP